MSLQSIKARFILLWLALVALAVAFRIVFALPVAQDQLRDVLAAQQTSLAQYIASEVEADVVARRDLVLAQAAALPLAALGRRSELDAWLAEQLRAHPASARALAVMRADDASVLGAAGGAPAGPALADAAWLRSASVADGAVFGRPQRAQANGAVFMLVAAPVRSGKRVVAVLAATVPLSNPGFLDRLQQGHFGESGGYLLISPQDKLFVASTDPSMVLKPTPPPGVNPLHDRAMGGFRGTGVTVNVKGVEEFVALASVPSIGWYVAARMPTDEAFRPVKTWREVLLKGSVIFTVLLVAMLLVVLPHILRPLTDLARAMREMADGKRELEPLPVVRSDEVGNLVLGFNYLVARLREKEGALKASEAHMAFIAHHDSLTGLYNRAMFEDRLTQAIARAERDERYFALLFVDLDHFKPINDELGHEVGDAVLVEVAARLSSGRRRVDTVARHGGDEFVILLTDLDAPHGDAESVARQYLAALAQPIVVGAHSFQLSASIGIALYQGEQISASQLMSRADVAMYQAKRSGKNTLCFFGEAMAAVGAALPAALADPIAD